MCPSAFVHESTYISYISRHLNFERNLMDSQTVSCGNETEGVCKNQEPQHENIEIEILVNVSGKRQNIRSRYIETNSRIIIQ